MKSSDNFGSGSKRASRTYKTNDSSSRSPFKLRNDTDDTPRFSPELLMLAYRHLVRARLLDEKSIVLYKQNKCHFQIGCAGHEAVQVAAALNFRTGVDWFYPYYRDMALCVSLGMTNREFGLNFMNKAADPNSHGRQMPMHYGHKDLRIVSQSSPTGTQFLQAVGCALAIKKMKLDEIVYVSAGEGTCAQGDFHEAMNWAARDQLPLVVLIQNNDYAISVHVSEQLAGKSAFKLAGGYQGLHRAEINGTDFVQSYQAFAKACHTARSGGGPSLIEAHVPRLQSHSISDNQLKYRSEDELQRDQDRCPLIHLRRLILNEGISGQESLTQLEALIRSEIESDIEWAEQQPGCDPERALANTLSHPDPALTCIEVQTVATDDNAAPSYLVDALNHALEEELIHNPKTYLFGEDVAHGKGGVFTVTAGLTNKFGNDRVFNTQLAESSIIGVAIGMATRGLKPIAEIQFGDYIWTGMMQIRNELAMLNYRSDGDFSCAAVIRVPVGGYIHGGAYHSQNIEATFAHFPGLLIAYPSNARDAKGLLKSAIRGSNPVLFLEHKGLYRQPYAKGIEGGKDDLIPFGRGKVVRPGRDLTVITWGAQVQKCLLASEILDEEGYELEVIDLRTIVPLDTEIIFTSVLKTSRVLIVHEDTKFMGFGAEIAATIASECFHALDAPVARVGMRSAALVPHSEILEEVVLPTPSDIVLSARMTLLY